MTDYRTPWDTGPAPAKPALLPGPAKPPRKPRGRRPITVGAATAGAGASPRWLYHHLTASGPAEPLAAFVAAARGSGVVPWRHDFAPLEEDVFNLAASQPPAQRRLGVAGCRILVRQFRAGVEAHQARAAARIGPDQACPFDLHVLLPVPDSVLQRGPADPQALAWLAAHWGVTDRLRERLLGLERAQAPAAWLDQRPQLGRNVFGRGMPDRIAMSRDARPEVDVVELLWACLALFEDPADRADTRPVYQPKQMALHSVTDARARILRLPAAAGNAQTLGQLLPRAPPAEDGASQSEVMARSAWTSTFTASLELA